MKTSAPGTGEFDLDAYLRRIGYAGELRTSLAALEALHLAHATRIPFENLDILLGRPIPIDIPSLQAKLVLGGRGGYCFEQNTLFLAALQALGFQATPLAARVRHRTTALLPRTHMLLLVALDGERWLADVGFGAEGLLLPVPLESHREARHFAWTYRVIEEAGSWVLQSLRGDVWTDLYAFTLEPQQSVDFQVANYYVSTHPDSRFVQTLTAQQPTPRVRHILRNRELVEDRGETLTRRILADDDELLDILGQIFGLEFPAGTRFRYR